MVKTKNPEYNLKVIIAKKQKHYAETCGELLDEHHSYFFKCICGALSQITEDAFLGMDDILCPRCKEMVRACASWKRESMEIVL